MRDLKVWARVGDQDDYHSFDSPDSAAAHVHEYLHAPDKFPDPPGAGACDHDVTRYTGPALTGVEVEEFSGDNGISLYWGDDDAQKECELTDLELSAFTNCLSS